MKIVLRITALLTVFLIGSMTFGQSLNFNGGFTSSKLKMEGMTDIDLSETYNGVTYNRTVDYKSIKGFNAAIAYEFRLGERLSLETGFKFQSRGYKQVSEYEIKSSSYSSSEKSTYKYKMNYLDLPIVLNTAILKEDFRLYARTGIYAGFMTGSKYSEESDYTSSDGNNGHFENTTKGDMDDFDTEERITLGALIGLGAEYKSFYFEANYNVGAFSIDSIEDEIYTHDFSFSLGYKIKFKK